MRKIIPVLFLLILVGACEEITQEAQNGNELIKATDGTVLYEVYKDSISEEYRYRFLTGMLGYELNYDIEDVQAMYEERLMKGNNNKFELYYKGKLTFVDSTAFVGINTENLGSMFDFFERDDTLTMHFFPNPESRKEFQEVSFYEGNIKSVQGYELVPMDTMTAN